MTARKDREMPTQAKHLIGCFALYSSIAQSVERMTVNHDVTGSSPVGGATKEAHSFSMSLNYLYTKFISGRSDNCFIGKEKIWSSKI